MRTRERRTGPELAVPVDHVVDPRPVVRELVAQDRAPSPRRARSALLGPRRELEVPRFDHAHRVCGVQPRGARGERAAVDALDGARVRGDRADGREGLARGVLPAREVPATSIHPSIHQSNEIKSANRDGKGTGRNGAHQRRTTLSELPETRSLSEGRTKSVLTKSECAAVEESSLRVCPGEGPVMRSRYKLQIGRAERVRGYGP